MSCIENVGRLSPQPNSTSSAAQSLSNKEIEDKLRGIDAFAIELIAVRIATKILERLGPANKFASDTESSDAFLHNLDILAAMTKIDEEQKPLLSKEETAKFLHCASSLIKKKIQDIFSIPGYFLINGVGWQLSNDHSLGMLTQIVEQAGLQLTINDEPTTYFIVLTLDKNLTEQNSELVFCLSEISGRNIGDRVELAADTFTISDLTAEFGRELSEERHDSD